MNRVSRLATAFCAIYLFALVSHAQFTTSDPSPAQDPSASPFAQQGTSLFAPATDQIQNSGLGVRILFVGRNKDGKTLTISAELHNLAEEPVYLALIGPPPGAVDTSGVTYELAKVAGLGRCTSLAVDEINTCIKNYGRGRDGWLPGAGFSLVQPDSKAIVTATFTAEQAGSSGFVSVTMNALLAKGSRPQDDRKKGDDNMTSVAISFPIAAIPELE